MATFRAEALSDQKGYKAISVEKPDGSKIDIFPDLRDMGLVPTYSDHEINPEWAYNTKVGRVVGNKVVKIKFDVKLLEDKTADSIDELKDPNFNNQKLKHVEDFIWAQKFRKTTHDYSIEDLVDGRKIFGREIPATIWQRLFRQRNVDREIFTFQTLLEAFYHFQNTGITAWKIDKTGKVEKDTSNGNAWKTMIIKGDTKTAFNAYGVAKPILNRLQAWQTGASALSKNIQMLGELDVEISKQGRPTSSFYGHMHLDGTNQNDIITAMPQSAINELAVNGARFASNMANRDMKKGEMLEGVILGTNYVVANNLPDVDTEFGTKPNAPVYKVIKAIKFPRGEFAPLVWLSNTGLDAVADYPNYGKKSATTHRTIEMTNEWSLEFIKQYTNLIYIVVGDKDYSVAQTT